MRTVFDGIPVAEMNTSMTINATAMWLLALYVAVADEQGADRAELAGTTQNDILKEYLSRGTHIFPPAPSIKLTTDVITWTLHNSPKWNPINVCSYHLQEAGADPVLEVAFALANAVTVLDAVNATRARSSEERHPPARRSHLVLLQRRHPVRRADVQDARVRRAVGAHRARALRRRRTRSSGASATACR